MFTTILLPIDLDHESSWVRALPVAIEMAAERRAEIHALTVLPDFGTGLIGGYFPPGFMEKAIDDATKRLEALTAKTIPDDIPVICHVAQGTIYEEILAMASEVKADLIVMASHRPELQDYLIGPNAARVVRHADISVLVVR